MLYSTDKVHLPETQNYKKYKMRVGGFKLNLGIYATLRFNPVVKDQTDIP